MKPTPTPSMKPKQKTVKARRMLTAFWMQNGEVESIWQLPADAASYDKMVRQMAALIPEVFPWEAARAIKLLAAIGIKESRR